MTTPATPESAAVGIKARIALYFLIGFVSQWIAEGTAILANGGTAHFTFLHWSLLVARSLWAGVVPVVSYIDNSSQYIAPKASP